MAKSTQTLISELDNKINLMQKDIDYLKQDVKDVKRLAFVLLGLFITIFVFLVSVVIAGAIK